MTTILLSNSAANLTSALEAFKGTVTVEAEFGDGLVYGTLATLAHHGKRAANPPPCTFGNEDFEQERQSGIEAIGLSHLDLDALGGVMAVLGCKPGPASFWELAGKVDVNGAHKLGSLGGSPADIRALHAWWAWSSKAKCFPPRDGTVVNITLELEAYAKALRAILEGDEMLLAAGDEFRKAGEELSAISFVEMADGVILRRSNAFVNHLYTSPNGLVAKAVVGMNPATGAVTVSLADPIPGVHCGEIVKELWGPAAGGHAGIAGSPREGFTGPLSLEAEGLRAYKALRLAVNAG